MGDSEAIGCLIHDFAELLSEKYYGSDDKIKKSHIGFGLYTLMDLADIVENKEHIDLDIMESLKKIRFYNDNEAVELIKGVLDSWSMIIVKLKQSISKQLINY